MAINLVKTYSPPGLFRHLVYIFSTNDRSIILAGDLIGLKKQAVFCNVYNSNVESERQVMWDYLISSQAALSMPWCLGGDFNAIFDSSKKIGGDCNKLTTRNFNAFLLRAKVLDLPLQGMSFTWTNFRDRASWSRLDRFLISPTMLSWFPNMVQRGLSRGLSYHNAIALGESKMDWGPWPFRFLDGWLEDRSMIADALGGWKSCNAKGSKGFVLATKTRVDKYKLKNWIHFKKLKETNLHVYEDNLALVEIGRAHV